MTTTDAERIRTLRQLLDCERREFAEFRSMVRDYALEGVNDTNWDRAAANEALDELGLDRLNGVWEARLLIPVAVTMHGTADESQASDDAETVAELVQQELASAVDALDVPHEFRVAPATVESVTDITDR